MLPAGLPHLISLTPLDRAAILPPKHSRQILRAGILHSTCSRADVEPDTTFREAVPQPGNIRGRDNQFHPPPAGWPRPSNEAIEIQTAANGSAVHPGGPMRSVASA